MAAQLCLCRRGHGNHSLLNTGEDISRRDRVLNRQIDADAADRRHGMRGVSNAQKRGLVPKRQPVDCDGQETHLIEAFEFVHAICEEGSKLRNPLAQGPRPPLARRYAGFRREPYSLRPHHLLGQGVRACPFLEKMTA
jgi:hypothetical protein